MWSHQGIEGNEKTDECAVMENIDMLLHPKSCGCCSQLIDYCALSENRR